MIRAAPGLKGLRTYALLLLFVTADSAKATTSLYSLSYGARSAGMAGATLALGGDALAQIINPANLAMLQRRLDVNVTYLRSNLRFTNPLNNHTNDRGYSGYPLSDNNFIIPAVGFAYPVADTPWTAGFQFYGLGGDAARFTLDDAEPPAGFGEQQLFRGNLALITFGPSAAYQYNSQFSLGATLQVTAARLKLNQPFGTSAPPRSTRFRFRFDMSEFGFHYTLGARLGATYKINDVVTTALTYQTPRNFDLDGGVTLLFPAGTGLETINTRGTIPLTLPHQVDVAFAIRPQAKLALELGYSWLAWSAEDPFQTFKVKLNPVPTGFPATLAAPLDWRDQHIVRIGSEYSHSGRLQLRAGYSFASNPVTEAGAFLTFPAYGFHTLTLGASWRINPAWDVSLALERALPISVSTQVSTVDSFHNNSREHHNQYSAQLQFGRIF